MHFIDQRSSKVLPDGGRSASDKDILIIGRFGGCAEICFDPAVNEMEGRSPLHFDRSMWLVSEDEDRVTNGGPLSPPTAPLAVAPRSTYRAEHFPTHDGGTHANAHLVPALAGVLQRGLGLDPDGEIRGHGSAGSATAVRSTAVARLPR
jgi:hypothetical protein